MGPTLTLSFGLDTFMFPCFPKKNVIFYIVMSSTPMQPNSERPSFSLNPKRRNQTLKFWQKKKCTFFRLTFWRSTMLKDCLKTLFLNKCPWVWSLDCRVFTWIKEHVSQRCVTHQRQYRLRTQCDYIWKEWQSSHNILDLRYFPCNVGQTTSS